jgi:hypothetical protein
MGRRKGTPTIEQDIFNALERLFKGLISGSLYPSGCRPLDSKLEDAVITVSNASAEQIQEGRARLNIYVRDIDNGSGRLVPDKGRIDELSLLDEDIVEALNAANTEYEFDLFQATDSIAEPGINQHFVNINLEFKRITF